MEILVYILVISSFLGSGMFSLNFGPASLSLFRFALILCFIFIVVALLRKDKRLVMPSGRHSTLFLKFFLLWFFYAILSGAWAPMKVEWVKGVYFLGAGVFSIYFIYFFVDSSKQIVRVFNSIFFVTLFHNLIGWSEILTNHYRFADRNALDRYKTFASNMWTRIPISGFANQNDYATMLIAGLFVSLIFVSHSKRLSFKLLGYAAIFSNIVLLILSTSRANLAAMILGILLVILIKFDSFAFVYKYKRQVAKVFVGLIVCLGLLLLVPVFREKVSDLLVTLQYYRLEGYRSISNRTNLILSGMYLLYKTFFFGVGAGNLSYYLEHDAYLPIAHITDMHNWWIEILSTFGLIIFIAYVLFFVLCFARLYRNYKRSGSRYSLYLMGFMGAFILGSMSSSSIMIVSWQWVFWACIIAYIKIIETKSDVLVNVTDKRQLIKEKSVVL